jgi:hypothetical protein
VANSIAAPPGGRPVVASWDRPLFYSADSDVFPSQHGPNNAHAIVMGWHVDYAATNPTFLAAVVDWWGIEQSGYSTNGGQSWTPFPTTPPWSDAVGFGTLAVGTPDNIVWVPSNRRAPYYTTNRGQTWQKITLPGVADTADDWSGLHWAYYLNRHIVAADRVNAGTFYMYHTPKGVFRSTNGGANWTLVKSGEIVPFSGFNAKLKTVPGKAGHLYFTAGHQSGENPSGAFMRSTDGGATWVAVPNVLEAYDFGFGKAAPDASYPAIFIAGWVNGSYGVWRSDNEGQSWTRIGTYPLDSLDEIKAVEGDKNVYGTVYVGFSGSGYAYGSITSPSGPYTLTVAKTGGGSGTVTSSPAGISCGADCSEAYVSGTVVTLTAAAASGSSFSGWSGACTGTGSCQVTMNAAKSVTATFALNTVTYNLTVAKSGTGSGTVTSSPAGISCGADCSEAYVSGTVVTLTAAAASGSSFSGWSGACTGTGSCQVTMNAAKSVTATFTLDPVPTYTLTVTRAGDGAGTVTSSPAGINCGADCSEAYSSGTVVTLTPTPTSGSVFAGWSGACTGTGACQVTMSSARSVTASFALAMYTLTVTREGAGSGTVTSSPAGIDCGADCAEAYTRGTVVSLTAVAAGGSVFGGWAGACSGTGACTVTMTATRGVTATFSPGVPPPVPGDFNGDGKPDLLWHNQVSGALNVWFLDGAVRTSEAPLTPDRVPDTKWQVKALADFNGDGHGDILWQHRGTGELLVWHMNRTTRTGSVGLTPKSFGGLGWQVRGVADLDGDGKPDILWHHQKKGTLYAWLMDGTTATRGAYLTPSGWADTGWQVAGLADFNGDGKADVLWRHRRTGDLYLWLMDGTRASGAVYLTPSRFADAQWRLFRLADLNGDGKTDILWQDSSTGRVLVWYMNGSVKMGQTFVTPSQVADPAWVPAPR